MHQCKGVNQVAKILHEKSVECCDEQSQHLFQKFLQWSVHNERCVFCFRAFLRECRPQSSRVSEFSRRGRLRHAGRHRLWQKHRPYKGAWTTDKHRWTVFTFIYWLWFSVLHRSSCASLISLVKTNASSARNTRSTSGESQTHGSGQEAHVFVLYIQWLRRVCFLYRNIATIAVFYALPVIQLVITYQTVWNPCFCLTLSMFCLDWTVMSFIMYFLTGCKCHRKPRHLLL